MVPTSHGSYTKNRGPGQPGYIWSNIKNELDEVAGFCGIYELQARGTLSHNLQSAVQFTLEALVRAKQMVEYATG